MKKIIPIFFCFLLLGCKKIEKVSSIIENQSNVKISIHYPITNIKKLDFLLEKETTEIYKDFKIKYESHYFLSDSAELNIDYSKQEINERYLNITLSTLIFLPSSYQPEYHIKTYVFDKKEKKILKINDLISEKEFKKLKTKIQLNLIKNYKNCLSLEQIKEISNHNYENYNLFTFTDHILTIYINPNEVTDSCGILSFQIPISELKLKIPILKEDFQNQVTNPMIPEKKEIDLKKPVIALTFDDGPSQYTKEIVEILKKYNARATFFVIGNKVEAYQDLLKESILNGNEIGNHSYSHKDLSRLSSEDLKEEVSKTQEIIKKTIGYTPKLLRPTYGERSNQMEEVTGLKVVLWTVDPKDWSKKTSKQIIDHILSKVKNKDIILLHDTKKRTVEAVKVIVPELIKEGYQFVTVSELESLK